MLSHFCEFLTFLQLNNTFYTHTPFGVFGCIYKFYDIQDFTGINPRCFKQLIKNYTRAPLYTLFFKKILRDYNIYTNSYGI